MKAIIRSRLLLLPPNSIIDSFEGELPVFWNSDIWKTTSFSNGQPVEQTIEAGTPLGGGNFSLRQWWKSSAANRPQWLFHSFHSNLLSEGDVFEFQYWLKYHENFNYNNTWNKSIIMRGVNGAKQELYINAFNPSGEMYVDFQHTNDTRSLYANINGGSYSIPLGDWVHYRWRFKIATETNGDPRNGYLYGWINSVKRWEHDNINTIYTGQYNELNLNTTMNAEAFGPDQKRYWDLFRLGKI